MDAHSRRQAALDAIDAVLDGVPAHDAETEVMDFKEEKGTIDSGGARRAISPRHEEAARALAVEAACFALDVIEERQVAGARIYLINIPPALEEVRGQAGPVLR